MATLRPLASLSSGLLARKGAARPAMRPQSFALSEPTPAAIEDLGWNDMGHAMPAPAPVAELHAADTAVADTAVNEDAAPDEAAVPTVLVERDALAKAIEAPPQVRSVSIPTATRLRRETAHAGKAALTLRLDADRHLRLRLAGAITNRSAQDLLVQALDALISSVPTVEALVAQLPAATPRKR